MGRCGRRWKRRSGLVIEKEEKRREENAVWNMINVGGEKIEKVYILDGIYTEEEGLGWGNVELFELVKNLRKVLFNRCISCLEITSENRKVGVEGLGDA